MPRPIIITEAKILQRAMELGDLTPEAARSFLSFKFDRDTTKQIRQLLQKNNRGTITVAERMKLEKYFRVGQFLDLLHAKARLSLQRAGNSN